MAGTNILKAMTAGFVATVVLSVLMALKSRMGLMPELDVIAMLTRMMGASSPIAGWIVHFIIGTVVWGGLFAWLNPNLPGRSHWIKGIVFGVCAWLLMMVAVLPMAGAGFFGINLGMMAPVMTLVLHIVYGAVMGAVYAAMRPDHRATVSKIELSSDLRGRAVAEREVEGSGHSS